MTIEEQTTQIAQIIVKYLNEAKNKEILRALVDVKTKLVKEMSELIMMNGIDSKESMLMGLDHAVKALDKHIMRVKNEFENND